MLMSCLKIMVPFFLVALSTARATELPALVAKTLDTYNVAWDSQSKDSTGSMPCGGHDVGLNAWVQNGELLFYMSRPSAFDENNTLLKLGRVRVKLSPNPFAAGGTFRQELKLKEGYIEIQGKSGEASATIKLWVEVARPVIHLDVHGEQSVTVEAHYESWRTTDQPVSGTELTQCFDFMGGSIPLTTHADTIEPGSNQVLWYHRNNNADLSFDKAALIEHLNSIAGQMTNPQKDLTFGGVMRGDDFVPAEMTQGVYATTSYKGWGIKSKTPKNDQSIRIYLHSEQAPSVETWKQTLEKMATASDITDDSAWKNNLAWWSDFWNRSYIFINSDHPNPADQGWVVGKNYQLFRYTLGCNAFGDYPTKFNGGLFTFDPRADGTADRGPAHRVTPDYRAWGGGTFTAQNQRLVYWPMLKSGDFDMMKPQFDFYARSRTNAEMITKLYWGHAGASFGEHPSNSGLIAAHAYWSKPKLQPRPGADISTIQVVAVRDLYDTVLEFCEMILQAQSYSGQDISEYLPLIQSCVTFFDEHYRALNKKATEQELDPHGHLVIYPSTANESFKNARNPTTVVSGLRTVLTSLLALPPKYGTAAERKNWQRVLDEIPPIPLETVKGQRVLAPAESYKARGEEFSAMYPVFPWHIYGLGRPDLDIARNTWANGARSRKANIGWHQTPVFAADLGLTEEAKSFVTAKFLDSKRRFPTFWGPNYDWTPDFNAGGVTMIAMQEMLLQTNGEKIYLAPAWPKDWNVDFKLHAPGQTTIEAQIRDGKLQHQVVTPTERAKDIIFGSPGPTPSDPSEKPDADAPQIP